MFYTAHFEVYNSNNYNNNKVFGRELYVENFMSPVVTW